MIISKLRNIFRNINTATYFQELLIFKYVLNQRNIESNKSITSNNSSYIISLTSYGKRVKDVYLVIESLALQTILPKHIFLVLDENEFKSKDDLPITLKRLMNRGLEVVFYKNIKSYKKFFPVFSMFATEYDIITVDDDILYPIDFSEILINGLDKKIIKEKTILGHRGHLINRKKNGKVKAYSKWGYEQADSEKDDSFLTTGAGVLFPKELDKEIFNNEDVFMKLCPNADDIWVNYMCMLNNICRKKVKNNRDFSKDFFVIPNNQDGSLFSENVFSQGNDKQLELLCHYFKKDF